MNFLQQMFLLQQQIQRDCWKGMVSPHPWPPHHLFIQRSVQERKQSGIIAYRHGLWLTEVQNMQDLHWLPNIGLHFNMPLQCDLFWRNITFLEFLTFCHPPKNITPVLWMFLATLCTITNCVTSVNPCPSLQSCPSSDIILFGQTFVKSQQSHIDLLDVPLYMGYVFG